MRKLDTKKARDSGHENLLSKASKLASWPEPIYKGRKTCFVKEVQIALVSKENICRAKGIGMRQMRKRHIPNTFTDAI